MSSDDLTWLLDDFRRQVADARGITLFSADGLPTAFSGMAEEEADALAALGASISSAATGASTATGSGAVRHALIESDEAYLLLHQAAERTGLLVVVTVTADLELTASAVEQLLARVGAHLATPVRR
ncbi:roadblock/LC7 domain-containing protein [Saccharopolyspora rhizosphaerae]|uniref:Roadblock/LC7 domain-containing protein n=1 Tax=Saccharopolyspora rhizosphaerae TaxID=2492662 RepID=A0A3R8QCX8_9PSEU|nr:roadblock/LC7 domain-containing protein [Saccharopolyspora rhizosphaerae]RRO18150.1 roadblock/LC7 domain-containing protein [Saccharopolyspora rhizosphaerae]